MALADNNISTYLVGSAIGSPSRDIGTLCTFPKINVWSKWKPIESNIDTMTLQELKDKRYGISILESNSITDLITQINNNGEKGFKYVTPRTKYRLGDFRNYDSYAPVPCEKTYLDEEEINIGGVISSNHGSYERDCGGIETMPTDTTLGVEDIYNFLDNIGNPIKLRRGCYITDGVRSVWYTDKFYWWTNDMQYFANKDVTIYEFYTNCIKGSDGIVRHPDSTSTGAWGTDKFYSIPFPKYTKHIQSKTPEGSKIVATILNASFTTNNPSSPYQKVSYEVYFDARGKEYRGGTINNVWIKLCRDKDGYDIIEQKQLENTLTIDKETRSVSYRGFFNNKPKDVYSPPSQNVWIIVWWNYQLQSRVMPLMERPDIQQ